MFFVFCFAFFSSNLVSILEGFKVHFWVVVDWTLIRSILYEALILIGRYQLVCICMYIM